jgi:exopolyphosphatase/guanosine-5'-triphosphate,3'-diphosphate pyrophosphatase
VILAGACIVRGILSKLGCDALTVSDRGLRHGLIAERFPLTSSPSHRAARASGPSSARGG